MEEPTTRLTWAALLGQWMDFAGAAVALPDDAEGRAWKASIPAIIGLQAVTLALGQAGRLDAEQRALGLDRARILIDRYSRQLSQAFAGQDLHPMLVELLDDARRAVAQAQALHEQQQG